MLTSRYLFITIFLIFNSSWAYIDKIVGLKQVSTGNIRFVCFDQHEMGTVEDNNEQADLFFNEVLPNCYKNLAQSACDNRLGIFCESMYFYNFFEREESKFTDLNPFDITYNHDLYKKLKNTQTTWISWQLPYRFITKFAYNDLYTQYVFLKSIDPRLPIAYWRYSMHPSSQLPALPTKKFGLDSLTKLFKTAAQLVYGLILKACMEKQNGQVVVPVELALIMEIARKINDQAELLGKILKNYFIEINNIHQDSLNNFVQEAHENDFESFLSDKNAIQKKLSSNLENFIFNDSLCSDIVDLLTLVNLAMPESPKYAIAFIGSAHAKNLVSYLQKIGYEQIDMLCDENAQSKDRIDKQMRQIPDYIGFNKSASSPNLAEHTYEL